MQYVEIIKQSFLFFPVLAFFITIPFIVSNYHKYGAIHKLRTLIIYSFVLYLLTIYFLVILPLPSIEEVREMTTPIMNLVPFSFVVDFIKETPLVLSDPSTYILALKHSSVYVVVFNIFMTIPFGMYLRYYYKCSFKKTILLSFLLSLFFEITQLTGLYFIYPRAYRLFDVDDLILNTLGGGVGYFVVALISKYLPSREKIDEETKELSKVVSPLRRLTICFIDLFLYLLFTIILGIFLRIGGRIFLVSFLLYYLVLPLLMHDATIGSKFLNVRKKVDKNPIFMYIMYSIFQAVYFFVLPSLLFVIFGSVIGKVSNILVGLFLMLVVFSFFLVFYVGNLIYLFRHKKMFYDELFKLEYVSTLK